MMNARQGVDGARFVRVLSLHWELWPKAVHADCLDCCPVWYSSWCLYWTTLAPWCVTLPAGILEQLSAIFGLLNLFNNFTCRH